MNREIEGLERDLVDLEKIIPIAGDKNYLFIEGYGNCPLTQGELKNVIAEVCNRMRAKLIQMKKKNEELIQLFSIRPQN